MVTRPMNLSREELATIINRNDGNLALLVNTLLDFKGTTGDRVKNILRDGTDRRQHKKSHIVEQIPVAIAFLQTVIGPSVRASQVDYLVLLWNQIQATWWQVALQYRRFGMSVVNQMFRRGMDRRFKEDLEQEAMESLYRAVVLYNPELSSFMTYATGRIRADMRRKYVSTMVKNKDRKTTSLDIGWDQKDDTEMFGLAYARIQPLDETPQGNPEHNLLEQARRVEHQDKNKFLMNILYTFSQRKQTIIRMILDGHTQVEVSQELGISKQRVNYVWAQFKDCAIERLEVEAKYVQVT